ncbi:MAG: type II toxin-antitoxin system VapC family toxin [Bacteroidota bacterium]
MKEPLLDTDTLSFYLKGYPNVVSRIDSAFDRFGHLNISVITYYEILNGLLFKDAQRQLKSFQQLLHYCQIIYFDTSVAELAATIYADLRKTNQMIGHTDVMIGATAILHDMVLVTNNQDHFKRILNLDLENWV